MALGEDGQKHSTGMAAAACPHCCCSRATTLGSSDHTPRGHTHGFTCSPVQPTHTHIHLPTPARTATRHHPQASKAHPQSLIHQFRMEVTSYASVSQAQQPVLRSAEEMAMTAGRGGAERRGGESRSGWLAGWPAKVAGPRHRRLA